MESLRHNLAISHHACAPPSPDPDLAWLGLLVTWPFAYESLRSPVDRWSWCASGVHVRVLGVAGGTGCVGVGRVGGGGWVWYARL